MNSQPVTHQTLSPYLTVLGRFPSSEQFLKETMKNLFRLLLIVSGCMGGYHSQAQLFSVGADAAVNIAAGTLFNVDKVTLDPSANFNLSNTTLTYDTVVANPTASTILASAYKFRTTTGSYSGAIHYRYTTKELKTFSEAGLNLFINNGTAWHNYSASVVDITVKIVTYTTTSALALNELTLGLAAQQLLVSVLLEGFYNNDNSSMNTSLNSAGLIPLTQPYTGAPWNYTGTESVASIPAGVVDWVLVELRHAATPGSAFANTKLAGWPRAYFLKSDGSLVDLDGAALPAIGNPSVADNLYVVISHRNHIAIMSAAGMTPTGNDYVYNFKDALSKAWGEAAGYRQIVPGVFGMVSGDTDSDGSLSVLDFSSWATDFGKMQIYLSADIDGDGQVSVLDFSKWAANFGMENISPLRPSGVKAVDLNLERRFSSQVPGR